MTAALQSCVLPLCGVEEGAGSVFAWVFEVVDDEDLDGANRNGSNKSKGDPPPAAKDDKQKQKQKQRRERERVYLPHLKIEIWGTRAFEVG